MEQRRWRLVLDTNTVLRGIASASSAASKVLHAAERRVFVPLLSKPVLDEYRAVLTDPAIMQRFPRLTPQVVHVTIGRLRYVSDYLPAPKIEFEFPRDTRDQRFLELAIAMDATHILSFDQDLLSLPISHSESGRRFRQRLPGVRVLRADQFLVEYAELFRPT